MGDGDHSCDEILVETVYEKKRRILAEVESLERICAGRVGFESRSIE